MYYLVVAGIIVSNFIPKSQLAQELKEANEDYRNKTVIVKKHTQNDINTMVDNFNKPYNRKIEVLK